MLHITILTSLIYSVLGASSIVDIQTEFAQLSQAFEPQLRDFRAKNDEVRAEVIHRMLNGLAELTVEVRDIARDTWTALEAHELTTPECLDKLREDYDYYVRLAELDIKAMALELDYYVRGDSVDRFNRDARASERLNSAVIFQTVQVLSRNQFLRHMDDTLQELYDELEQTRILQGTTSDRLTSEIARISYLEQRVETSIAWWSGFTVTFFQAVMKTQLERPNYEC